MPERTTGKRMPLTDIKSAVRPGNVYEVTNHHLTRPDHPWFGTSRRTVTRVTSSRFYLSYPDHGVSYVDWPRASQADMDPDGTIRLYGGGAGQRPDELFLTLVPARDADR
jgi:hypothetical protein